MELENLKNVVGLETFVKFYPNMLQDTAGRSIINKLTTRTLGKIGFVDKKFSNIRVQEDEIWRVRILDENQPGADRGCFLLEPLHKLERTKIAYVIPGVTSQRIVNGIMVLVPEEIEPGVAYMIPAEYKKSNLGECHAFVVCDPDSLVKKV